MTVIQLSKRHFKRNLILATVGLFAKVIIVLLALGVSRADVSGEPSANSDDTALRMRVEKIVEDYLRKRPEIIEQAIEALETRRLAEEKERVKDTIAARQDDLLKDPASPTSGNPAADVTVVEFFDYRCGFCKKAAGTVAQLQKDDTKIRVVYKDLPILGEDSVFAAKATLAAHAQGKHHAFHEALYAAKVELIPAQVMKIASQVGLDTKKVASDMKNPQLDATIARNHALAKDLGINGTPAFIIGTELVPGAIELDRFKEVIARTRSDK